MRAKVQQYKGINFKSKLEVDIYKKIKKQTKNVMYETKKYPYILEKFYLPDFVCTKADGSLMLIEVKGYLRPEDRSKTIAVLKHNPGIDLRFVFSKDNFIRKGSKTKYSDWCKKYFLPCSFGSVPKEWFN